MTSSPSRRRRLATSPRRASVPAQSGEGASSAKQSGKHQRRPVALVTGATSGIGLAICRDLARDHNLILVARTQRDVTELASVLSAETQSQVTPVAVDVTDDEALAQAIEELHLSRLDVLVHSAGVEAVGTIANTSAATWREVLNCDLVGIAELTRLTLPALRRAKGLVILMNSGAGTRTWPEQAVYCAAKAGLKAFADVLRLEEGDRLRVTSIYPGRVDTPMQRRIHKVTTAQHTPEGEKKRSYRPSEHMSPEQVSAAVRLAVDTPPQASVHDLHIRPTGGH